MTATQPNVLLHGEIVSWDIPSGTQVSIGTLRAALAAAQFDESFARDMQPRNAFTRAAASMEDKRIIRKLADRGGQLWFQFTREDAEGDGDARRLAYNFEAVLILDKATGAVTCDGHPDLVVEAERLINLEKDTRYTNDITRIMSTIFVKNADVFPVRSQGGCYFVPAKFSEFLDRLDAFLTALARGASLRRFPVPAGFPAGDRSVKESVDYGLGQMIDEHLKAVEAMDDSTRKGTADKAMDLVRQTRFKIEAYADFLGDKQADLLKRVEDAREVLRQKMAALFAVATSDGPEQRQAA